MPTEDCASKQMDGRRNTQMLASPEKEGRELAWERGPAAFCSWSLCQAITNQSDRHFWEPGRDAKTSSTKGQGHNSLPSMGLINPQTRQEDTDPVSLDGLFYRGMELSTSGAHKAWAGGGICVWDGRRQNACLTVVWDNHMQQRPSKCKLLETFNPSALIHTRAVAGGVGRGWGAEL